MSQDAGGRVMRASSSHLGGVVVIDRERARSAQANAGASGISVRYPWHRGQRGRGLERGNARAAWPALPEESSRWFDPLLWFIGRALDSASRSIPARAAHIIRVHATPHPPDSNHRDAVTFRLRQSAGHHGSDASSAAGDGREDGLAPEPLTFWKASMMSMGSGTTMVEAFLLLMSFIVCR